MSTPLQPETIENKMIKKDELIEAIITDPELQQRLAKHIVLRCFRNSVLEDLHAGKVDMTDMHYVAYEVLRCYRKAWERAPHLSCLEN